MVHNIYGEEYLGRKITVLESRNSGLQGITGIVVKETKNMFSIETSDMVRQIPKDSCDFNVNVEGTNYLIKGKLIRYRPENRLKELRKINKNLRRMN
jgi:ribonuclease P protein subunit POP4